MKILKNNNGLQIVCPYCNSELLLELSDIKAMDDHGERYPGCACGACGRKLFLTHYLDKMPSLWRDNLEPLLDERNF